MGATNRPGDLDEAARRRLVKRIYVPLPNNDTRYKMIEHLLQKQKHNLTPSQIAQIAKAKLEAEQLVCGFDELKIPDAMQEDAELLSFYDEPNKSTN